VPVVQQVQAALSICSTKFIPQTPAAYTHALSQLKQFKDIMRHGIEAVAAHQRLYA
jgi:hypothetical protein